MFDVVGIGRNCVDHLALVESLPDPDRKVPMKDYRVASGGQAATALVALSRLGLSTAYLGVVGNDPGGAMVREELHAAGVDISSVVVDDTCRTPVALILVDRETGGRTIAYQETPPVLLKHSRVSLDAVLSARLLMIDPHETAFALSVAPLARDKGIPILYDAEHPCPGLEDMLRLSDYVVASRDAVEAVGAGSVGEALEKIFSAGPRAVVITLGKEGCVARTGDGVISRPAYPVRVVDTTAAGDAFHAGFAFGILREWGIAKTLEFASALGALVCRGLGGRETLPNLEEILAFLREKGGWR